AAGGCRDEAGGGGVVGERNPQLTDREPHDGLGYRYVSPDGIEQRLLGDQIATALRAGLQDCAGLRAQGHRSGCLAQHAPAQIELEGWELDEMRSARSRRRHSLSPCRDTASPASIQGGADRTGTLPVHYGPIRMPEGK